VAEHKAGQPFEIVLYVTDGVYEGDAEILDALVADIHNISNAGGGKVIVRWEPEK